MGQKRSIGVTVFSILILIGAIFTIIGLPVSFKTNPMITNILQAIVAPASLVTAIFLFKLKRWARVAIIIINIIVFVQTVAMAQYVMSSLSNYYVTENSIENALPSDPNKYIELIESRDKRKLADIEKKNIIDNYPETKRKIVENANKVIKITFTSAVAMSLLFNAIVIFFFTRPKVKAQFS